jgi:hypothetical protein
MMHRELYFATPVYIKDVGTSEYNDYLTDKIIEWSKNDEGLKKLICMVGTHKLICTQNLNINI